MRKVGKRTRCDASMRLAGSRKPSTLPSTARSTRRIQPLRKRKARIARELEEAAANDLVQESIREFCLRTKERLEKCTTFDMTRQFLVDHVQRIIYLRNHVTLIGSEPGLRAPSHGPNGGVADGLVEAKAAFRAAWDGAG